ncbi:hypothetical protein KCP70_08330 [Salmonella enterica subsp. enterica]|nr:hypothetical protein KCP70_08330 [Salmonella enterica subsp. enterica]
MTCRPADLLKPELAEGWKRTSGAGAGEGDYSGGKRHRRRCSPWRCSRRLALNSREPP